MAFVDDVNKALTDAMRARDERRLSTLRMLKSALVNRSVERGHTLDDHEATQVVATLIKQRRESIEQFTKGGRQELADKEAAEIKVLEGYLPPAVSMEEVEQVVADAIAETGAAGPKDLGKVMKAALARLAGKTVEGKLVNEVVRKKLGG
ncbi:MAG: GatB/YqeY domain-containing protein [Acidobacteria bacterium]|nr:GatB/YqeY domain-containing protein [Acidobacteriota bacterium]MBI3263705.1 GatB/YqeY domain-containing protein [Acidobacteriota bacterium]